MTKITVIGKQSHSIEQFYENRIAEKSNGSDGIFNGKNQRNDYDCYFCAFGRKKKSSERKETEGQRNMAEDTDR